MGECMDMDGDGAEVTDAGPQVAEIDAGMVAATMNAHGEESKDNTDQVREGVTVGGARKSINDVLCAGMGTGVRKVALPEKPSKKGQGGECGGTHSQKLSIQ